MVIIVSLFNELSVYNTWFCTNCFIWDSEQSGECIAFNIICFHVCYHVFRS